MSERSFWMKCRWKIGDGITLNYKSIFVALNEKIILEKYQKEKISRIKNVSRKALRNDDK